MNDFVADILMIILILFGAPYFISVIISPFYFKFGFGKVFYHDVMGWHRPKEDEENTFDEINTYNYCKYCGKRILQDSQGNWFTGEDL
jgi:hypothetical protein